MKKVIILSEEEYKEIEKNKKQLDKVKNYIQYELKYGLKSDIAYCVEENHTVIIPIIHFLSEEMED